MLPASYIHSAYFLITRYVPGTVLGSGAIAGNKIDKISVPV